MDVENKGGKYQWAFVTKIMDGWKLLTANVEKSENLMDLFKDRHNNFGLDPLLVVPTYDTSTIRDIPLTITGEDCWYADISNFKSVLVDIHALSLDQVRGWSGWFMGGESQEV